MTTACPRCTNAMTWINPRAHVCHDCQIAVSDHPTDEQLLVDALQGEINR